MLGLAIPGYARLTGQLGHEEKEGEERSPAGLHMEKQEAEKEVEEPPPPHTHTHTHTP